jgi:hypothetical protein
MKSCEFCDKEFESDRNLHIHWGEKHEDELNSHQQEKVKKAQRQQKEEKENKTQKRRKLLFKGLTAGSLIIFAVLIAPQILSMFQSSPFELDRQPMMGDENASVTVVKFGDYQCPHCKTWDQEIKPRLKENYIDSGQVKFYYINFPVINQNSDLAAKAGEYVYANDRENFWKTHKELYSAETQLTEGRIINIVTETTNLTESEIRQGLESTKAENELQADKRIANGNGITGTPTVYVNGERIGNDYNSLKTAVDKQLENGN